MCLPSSVDSTCLDNRDLIHGGAIPELTAISPPKNINAVTLLFLNRETSSHTGRLMHAWLDRQTDRTVQNGTGLNRSGC